MNYPWMADDRFLPHGEWYETCCAVLCSSLEDWQYWGDREPIEC